MRIKPFKQSELLEEHMNAHFELLDSDGKLTCPAGFELVQVDEHEWRCTGGNHRYRFDEGTLAKDKFGNVYFMKNHPGGDSEEGLQNNESETN